MWLIQADMVYHTCALSCNVHIDFTYISWYMDLAKVPIISKKCNADNNLNLLKNHRNFLINAHIINNFSKDNKHGKN